MKKPRINSFKLSNKRKDPLYEAVFIDLALMGIIEKGVVEKWLDIKISDNLKPPRWYSEDEAEE